MVIRLSCPWRRHKNSLDCFVEIHSLRQYVPERYTAKVTWWTSGYSPKMIPVCRQTIHIKREAWGNWAPCDYMGEFVQKEDT